METIFLKPHTIKEFLKKYKGDISSQDYEFLVSLVLSNFYKKRWKTDTLVGFKLKDKYVQQLPNKGKTNLLRVKEILRKMIDTNTPIDLVISPEKIKSLKRKTNKGVAFQLKRFYKNVNRDCTCPLIEYLNNEIPAKYSKTKAVLFIIPEGSTRFIDLKRVAEHFNTNNFPFSGVMFLLVSKGFVYVGEIWPNPGMNRYNPEDLI